MSQEEIIKLLENNPNKIFSSRDIAKRLNVNATSINNGLKSLRRTNLIKYFQIQVPKGRKFVYYKGNIPEEVIEEIKMGGYSF